MGNIFSVAPQLPPTLQLGPYPLTHRALALLAHFPQSH